MHRFAIERIEVETLGAIGEEVFELTDLRGADMRDGDSIADTGATFGLALKELLQDTVKVFDDPLFQHHSEKFSENIGLGFAFNPDFDSTRT